MEHGNNGAAESAAAGGCGDLRETPLAGLHRDLGARLVPFAGWLMPVQYTSILEEHRAVRSACGLFDVSHMGEVRVEGPGAEAFLDFLLTNRVAGTPPGRAVYSCMCDPGGGVVDDLIVYRLDGQVFLLCVNAANTRADIDWMRAQAGPAGFAESCQITDVSDDYALLALQGPRAAEVLGGLPDIDLAGLRRFGLARGEAAGVPGVLISRTGYTGEDGFELFCPPARAEELARALLSAGAPAGLLPCGLGARDSLRLEAGYPLHGHEIGGDISPLEAGLDWTVKFAPGRDFVGRRALAVERDGGVYRRVVYFVLPGRRIARAGAVVERAGAPGEAVGRVLSGTLSPLLEKPIGSALLQAGAAGDGVLEVDLRGHRVPLEVKKPPLHR